MALKVEQWRRLWRGSATIMVCVAGIVLSASAAAECKFGTPRGSPQLVFPVLQSTSASLVLSRPLDIPFECTGGVTPGFAVVGAHDAGPGTLRMRHESRDSYLTYTIRIEVTQVGQNSVLRLTGEVSPASVEQAFAGAYGDVISVTVKP